MIPDDDYEMIESVLYLPMLLRILERDRVIFEQSAVKFKLPYIKLMDETIKRVRKELKSAKSYLRNENIILEKLGVNGDFTAYRVFYKGYIEDRNYWNVRLRNRTEELLEQYLNDGRI
ncbi:hypothetical protein [Bacillus massiliglaciei]|uniref:hypothetical protein n=1 Tax=Bacillus massiliglaciei TaxID=1816693 RepID=UPI000DA5FD07|nr:hypothetical protein [Bacillus massiliglaciei]